MNWFKRNDDQVENVLGLCDELDAALDGFEVIAVDTHPTILDRSAEVVSRFLSEARAEKVRLEANIREMQEQLRQTCVAIDAFEPTLVKLDDGYDPAIDGAKSYEVAIAAKRKRASRAAPVLQAAE